MTALLSELTRVKAIFQMRAVCTAMGIPHSNTCANISSSSSAGVGEGAPAALPATIPDGLIPAEPDSGEDDAKNLPAPFSCSATLSGEGV